MATFAGGPTRMVARAADPPQRLLKLLQIYRFLEKRARLEHVRLLLCVERAGEYDEWNRGQRPIAKLRCPKSFAVHVREHEVEDDRARVRCGAEIVKGLSSVRDRSHLIPFVAEAEQDDLPHIGVILDDENGATVIHRAGPLPLCSSLRWRVREAFDGCCQLQRIRRFRHVHLKPRAERRLPVLGSRETRERRGGRQPTGLRVEGANPFDQLDTACIRQEHVAHQHIGVQVSQARARLTC
jgi:hypothetical protein